AAAGGAEQDEAVARVDGEADFVGGTHDALAGAVFQADPLDFQQRRRRQGRRLGLAQARAWVKGIHQLLLAQNGTSPWMVVRCMRRRRWAGQPVARWIRARLSQNTRSLSCQRWR